MQQIILKVTAVLMMATALVCVDQVTGGAALTFPLHLTHVQSTTMRGWRGDTTSDTI